MKSFKWSYNSSTEELQVWPVSGPESWASPQHGEKLSSDEYASLYQGRLVLDDDNSVLNFIIYDERPFSDRTQVDAEKAVDAVYAWVRDQKNLEEQFPFLKHPNPEDWPKE